MYSVDFWRKFNTRTDLNTDILKTVVTDSFVYNISHIDNPQLNKVYYIKDGDLNSIFEELNRIFKDKKNGFEVAVRETDNKGLHDFLEANGYVKTVVSENLILELTETTVTSLQKGINNSFELQELSRSDMAKDEIYEMFKSCFPSQITSKEGYDSVNDAMFEQANAVGSVLRNYVLYDGELPVAFGSLFDMGKFQNLHLAMLSGAGTIPNYRNQKLYTTMLYQRCREAIDLGIEVLFIQADIETSAPIVRKYGFQLVDKVTEYHPVKSVAE